MNLRRRQPPRLALAALLCLPGLSHAHSSVAGMNSFYGGLLHPLLTLPHMLVLLGLGIWLGQHPPLRLKTPMLAFATSCAAALLLTTRIAIPPSSQNLVMAVALGCGILVAVSARLPVGLRAAVAAVAAIAVALDSGVDGAPTVLATALTLLGTWISTTVLVANVAYYTSLCPPRQWVQIALRIAGSWMAAASVLVLAFALKGMPPG
ncbi:HupE/UreJ family protein [Rhodoferax sp.]|uniref:HupE/UreJ family protein n=1 Tax=Rhodoferax sp. TaxID=50421 RepID=UPI0025EEE380|nr:HupE/UreJ family protein [Rhodoferax sp.]